MIKVKWSYRGGPWFNMLSVLRRDENTDVQKEDAVNREIEVGDLGENSLPVPCVVLDFQLQRQWTATVKATSLWWSVMGWESGTQLSAFRSLICVSDGDEEDLTKSALGNWIKTNHIFPTLWAKFTLVATSIPAPEMSSNSGRLQPPAVTLGTAK